MKRLLSLVWILSLFCVAKGQNLPGYWTSNYAGISKIDIQPASIVDSRYKWDIQLFSINTNFYNNYIGLTEKTIPFYLNQLGEENNIYSQPSFTDDYFYRRSDDRDKSIFFNTEIMLPSVMYSIDRKNAVGLTWKIRTLFNVDGLSPEMADLIYEELMVEELWGRTLKSNDLSIQSMTWAEYGASYGRVIMDKEPHFLKVGARVKLLQGIQSGYMYLDAFEYNFTNDDTLTILRTTAGYGHSESFDPSALAQNFREYTFDGNATVGFDFGVVYEYRPNGSDYQYDMDGEYDVWFDDKNKYKWKVGASVTDIGRIVFDKAPGSRDFIAEVNEWDIRNVDPSDIETFDDTLVRFTELATDERSYSMQLPTSISLQIDYNIWKNFYVNATPFWTFKRYDDKNRVHYIGSYSITPRWDSKWFGAFMPISYNDYGNSAVGLSLRAGPIFFGTTNLLPWFAKVRIYGADFHAAVKVPLFKRGKPADRDNDGVSDKNDECIDVPGPWKFRGCPDSDNDGIRDAEDECPTDSGVVELGGCPDKDLDGIADKYDECPDLFGELGFRGCPDSDGDSLIDPKDKCPDLAGLLYFDGCPDTDNDSIIDPEDLCPEHPGPLINQGCPDRDNDGIFDYLDECPEVAGPKDNNGCPWPDTDEDGILDRDDRCPNNPGPAENFGCPYTDTDEDGVLDKDDDCPNTPGPADNNGCPELKKKEQEIINTAFSNLEFETAKAKIRASSLGSLDELAELLIKKPEFKLLLAGHTDNVGNDQDNLILSKRRAEAVRDHLVKKGVPTEKIKVEFYGETEPIADNNTAEGRQKNRRVEMEIKFD